MIEELEVTGHMRQRKDEVSFNAMNDREIAVHKRLSKASSLTKRYL